MYGEYAHILQHVIPVQLNRHFLAEQHSFQIDLPSLMQAVKGAAMVILVNPNNPQEIAEAIKQLTSSQELVIQMAEKGLENIKRFSWQTTARQTLDKLLS